MIECLSNPKVSVIVPVYNSAGTIDQCLNSVLNQNYTNYEIIIIDDGSTDSSGVICDKYCDKNDKVYVFHTENRGVSSARNLGIEKATGEYVLFIDSDDSIDKEYIEDLINLKNQYKEIDNIWCGFKTYSIDTTADESVSYVYDKNSKISLVDRKNIMTLHEKWLDAGPYCKLYSRNILKKTNVRFPENLSLGEDLVFNFQYLDNTNGKICFLNKATYNYYLQSGNSLATKYYDNLFDIYKTINKVMERYIRKWDCDTEEFKKYYNACFFKFEVCLKNTFNTCNSASKQDKYRRNNEILNSCEFQEAFNNMSYSPNPLLFVAYKTKNYFFVRIADSVLNVVWRIYCWFRKKK